MRVGDSFNTSEEELNFILGDNGDDVDDDLFDIDAPPGDCCAAPPPNSAGPRDGAGTVVPLSPVLGDGAASAEGPFQVEEDEELQRLAEAAPDELLTFQDFDFDDGVVDASKDMLHDSFEDIDPDPTLATLVSAAAKDPAFWEMIEDHDFGRKDSRANATVTDRPTFSAMGGIGRLPAPHVAGGPAAPPPATPWRPEDVFAAGAPRTPRMAGDREGPRFVAPWAGGTGLWPAAFRPGAAPRVVASPRHWRQPPPVTHVGADWGVKATPPRRPAARPALRSSCLALSPAAPTATAGGTVPREPGPSPPVIHLATRPAPLAIGLDGPPRKRRATAAPADPNQAEAVQTRAAVARRFRRKARARGQVVNLVGGGDVGEIQRRAVADAAPPSNFWKSRDFWRGVDPRALGDLAFESLIAASRARKDAAQTAADVEDPAAPADGQMMEVPPKPDLCPSSSMSMEDEPSLRAVVSPPKAPSGCHECMSSTPMRLPAAAIVTPTRPHVDSPAPAQENPEKATNKKLDDPSPTLLKALPTGKDPESRRLRRLMRNRHSAQVSRDRRRRALEDRRRLKAAKEEEIRALERNVNQEIQCMMQLEEAVSLAREYLGHAKYSQVAAAFRAGDGRSVPIAM